MRKSKYSIFAPKVRRDIRKEEEKLGREFTKEERKEFRQKDIKKLRRKAAIVGILAAIGIGGVTTTTKLLNAPKQDNVKFEQQYKTDNFKSKEEKFREELQTETPVVQTKTEEKEENILKEVANKCNLTEENIGIIKSCPRFLGIDKEGNYSFDYYEKTEIVDSVRDRDVGDLYTIINRENNQIISAIGEANLDVVNVDVKQIKVGKTEYTSSNKMIDLTVDEDGNKKTKQENDKMYSKIKNAYEEKVKGEER